jgi:hypothetical protein
MSRNFLDPRGPYAGLRRAFVYKEKLTRTPPYLGRPRLDIELSDPALSGSSATLSRSGI